MKNILNLFFIVKVINIELAKLLPYIFETYFNYQTKDIFTEHSRPTNIDLRSFILYKTPEIIKKTKSINELIINDNFPIDYELISNKNIKIVNIHSKNNLTFVNNVVQSKIACLQNLYSLNHVDLFMEHGSHACNYFYDG